MLKRLLALIKKEFLAIWKDPKSRYIIILPPLFELIIFASALTMEVKNVDVVVLDRSSTLESRELIKQFQYSRWFRHFYHVDTEKEFANKINTQKVQMGLMINNDFARKIQASEPVSVQIITDGRHTYTARIIAGYSYFAIGQYNKSLAKKNGASVNVEIRNWFNPNLLYQWFILVALITLLALMATIILTALSIARERELGTFDQLIVSPFSSFEILVGKTIPPLVIAMCLTCCMVAIGKIFFRMPFAGSLMLFLSSILIALLSIVGIGLFISSICKTQQQALIGVFTFETPAILLSGFYSPVENMPIFIQHLTLLNPIRFFLVLSRGLIIKGIGINDVIVNIIPLLIIAAITLSLAGWMFKRKLD